MTVTVTIGGIALTGMEVPASIPWGGDQGSKVHKLVGGQRVIDTMGRDDELITWTGRFYSEDAVTRALSIDAIRKAGGPVALTWGQFAFTIVVKTFKCNYEYILNQPYSIICEIVTDDANPNTADSTLSLDDVVASDMSTATSLSSILDNSAITSGLATLQGAVSAVSSFASASRSEINTVLSPLTSLQGAVADLSASIDGGILGAASDSVAGVVAGSSNLAATLLAQVSASQTLPTVNQLSSVLGRIQGNLTSAQTSGVSVTLVGGNLNDEAIKAYGNQDSWPAIAEANNLTDPVLTGTNSLIIPPSGGAGDGILEP